jgi:hypothetical protein
VIFSAGWDVKAGPEAHRRAGEDYPWLVPSGTLGLMGRQEQNGATNEVSQTDDQAQG